MIRSTFADSLRHSPISLNTIVRQATRLPLPLVFTVRNRTVANVDSIGFVVRMCRQCSAGKS